MQILENFLIPVTSIITHNIHSYVQIVHGQFMISVPSTLAFVLLDITICTFLISLFWVFKTIIFTITIVNLLLASLMNQNHPFFQPFFL